MSADKDLGKDQPGGITTPSTSKFNYASAIFRSIKRQKLEVTEPELKDEPKPQEKGDGGSSQESLPNLMTYEVDDLREQAIQKLKQEATRNAERAQTMGPRGWIKPALTVNKQFLGRMVQSTKSRSDENSSGKRSPDGRSTHRSDERSSRKRSPDGRSKRGSEEKSSKKRSSEGGSKKRSDKKSSKERSSEGKSKKKSR